MSRPSVSVPNGWFHAPSVAQAGGSDAALQVEHVPGGHQPFGDQRRVVQQPFRVEVRVELEHEAPQGISGGRVRIGGHSSGLWVRMPLRTRNPTDRRLSLSRRARANGLR